MNITVKTNELKEKHGSTIAIANVDFGDQLSVKNITVVEGKNGRFVSMPSVSTNKVNEQGDTIYNEVFNPVTAKGREQLVDAVLDSLDTGKPVVIRDEEGRSNDLSAVVKPLENNFSNALGVGRLYLNDDYVVNSIFIRQSSKGGKFVSFPAYKSNEVDEQGKPVYKEFITASRESREKITGIIMDAYDKANELSRAEIVADEVKPKGVKAKLKDGQAKSRGTKTAPKKEREEKDR